MYACVNGWLIFPPAPPLVRFFSSLFSCGDTAAGLFVRRETLVKILLTNRRAVLDTRLSTSSSVYYVVYYVVCTAPRDKLTAQKKSGETVGRPETHDWAFRDTATGSSSAGHEWTHVGTRL